MNFRNIVVALECYVKKDGKYLMLHRSLNKKMLPGVWLAPGGKREFNEGLFACAKREILEETGLKIKNLQLRATGVGHLQDLDQEVFFDFLTADWESGEVNVESDVGELKWLTLPEILKLPNLLSELKTVLPLILNGSGDVISYTSVYRKGNEMIDLQIENAN